jgi:hypothetical protein
LKVRYSIDWTISGGDLLHLDLPERIALNTADRRLFINFEKVRVRSLEDVTRIREEVEKVCAPLGHPVDVIVNYDGFQLDEDVASDYAAMVAHLEDRFYETVTRYSGSAFMRMKHGKTLLSRTPHIYETREATVRDAWFLTGSSLWHRVTRCQSWALRSACAVLVPHANDQVPCGVP